jgi:DNA-binding beta-propeller fold protein YncE
LCGEATGDGTLTGSKTKEVAVGGAQFVSPFDAAPGPDGCVIYFTAVDPATGGGAVFSVNKDGTGLKRLDQGNALVAPVGIAVSSDGGTLYVADVGYSEAGADAGAILALSAEGGAPSVSIAGRQARSIALVKENDADQLYFGGTSPSGEPTLYKATPGGGPSAVVAGGGIVEPGGIASDGSQVFLVSSTSASASGVLFQVAGGAATSVVGGLKVGLNGGAALAGDASSVLVAARDPASGSSAIARVVLADKSVAYTVIGSGQVEPSGLHRALNAEVYAFVDGLGTSGSGAVWVAEK